MIDKKIQTEVTLYKVVISVCQSVCCMSDHNSWTPWLDQFFPQILIGKLLEPEDCSWLGLKNCTDRWPGKAGFKSKLYIKELKKYTKVFMIIPTHTNLVFASMIWFHNFELKFLFSFILGYLVSLVFSSSQARSLALLNIQGLNNDYNS